MIEEILSPLMFSSSGVVSPRDQLQPSSAAPSISETSPNAQISTLEGTTGTVPGRGISSAG